MTVSYTTLRATFVSESAGYQNTFGWYNRETGIGGILFANVEDEGRRAPLTPGASRADFTVATADVGKIEFFLVSDGARLNKSDPDDFIGPIKVIRLADGSWAVADLDANGNVITKNGKPDILQGAGANALFTETSKNAGGVDYASSKVGSQQTAASLAGDTADGATGLLAWEDLAATRRSNGTYTKPGDADYNDAVFNISILNTAPTARNDAASVGEDSGTTTINVLSNDTAGTPGQTLQITAVNGAGLLGTIAIAADGRSILYSPSTAFQSLAAGQTATESFSYTITDQSGGTATATVQIAIAGANDAAVIGTPTASSVAEDSSVNGAGQLTASGRITITDVDQGQASLTSATGAAGNLGTLALAADGTYTYAVANSLVQGLGANDSAVDTFTITSLDGTTRQVSFTIHGANDGPASISIDKLSVNENTAGAVVGVLTVSDADRNDTHTFAVDDDRFEVVNGTLRLRNGVTLDYEDQQQVLVKVTATDTGGLAISQTFTIGVGDGAEGTAVDGYIAGATVFADANNNGRLDAGEISATTDANGNFTLFGGTGPLVMQGGTDISTNQAFAGVMRAPTGSTVVTPLTTLVVAVAEATGQSVAAANAQVLQGLGLSAGTNLATFDPIAAALSSNPTLQTQGEAAIAAAIQLQNTIVQAASLLDGAGAASFEVAAAAVVTQLAVALSAQVQAGNTLDLESTSVVTAVITSAATTAGADATSVAATAAGAANVISASNTIVSDAADTSSGTALLTTLAQISAVAQGDAAPALANAGTQGTTAAISAAEANFTGTNLTTAVGNATVGDVDGANSAQTIVGTAASDILQGFAGNDTIQGLGGNDVLQGRDGNDVLDGGAGLDRATYIDAAGSVSINMAAGTASGAGVGSDTLISIEAVRGSSFGDTFVATGYAGNIGNFPQPATRSSFEGMGGNDTITGNGDTQISYLSATAGVTVDMVLGTAIGDASVGTDTFTGVSFVRGSAFGDTLLGSNNATNAQQFYGGAGDDFIDGRGGFDRVTYLQLLDNDITGGISINMTTGVVTGDASVGTDTLRSIESVRGTQFADTYVATGFGQAGALNVGNNGTFNEIEGGGGNDTITGNGITRLTFQSSTDAVTADIAAGTATSASTGTDTFTGVNQLVGSTAGDTFYGSNNAVNTSEQFDGRGGNDTFDGRGGFDQAIYNQDNTVTTGITVAMAAGTVTGDAAVGTDTLRSIESVRGTNLADTYDATGFATASALNIGSAGTIGAFGGTLNEFEGAGGNDTITGSGDTRISHASATGSVIVDLAAGTVTGDSSVGSDVITGGVARVRGSNFNDTISGDSGANLLEGLNGSDRIDGRGGNDTLTGGANADTFVIGSGGGANVITDFTQVQSDRIDLTGVVGFYSLADILEHATGNGTSTIIDLGGGNTLTLSNIAPAALLAGDFIFGTPGPVVGDNNDNTLVGTSVADLIQGLDGNDNLQGRAGNDTLEGGAGRDRAIYIDATGAITVDLAAGTATGNAVGTDTLRSIEIVRGSNFADTLVSTGFGATSTNAASDNSTGTFEGMGGNDIITGNGSTQISYQSATSGVTVDFALGTAIGDASVGTDTYTGVNAVRGTEFADFLYGSGAALELFIGTGGDDYIDGRGGNDRVSYTSFVDNTITAGVTVDLAAGTVTGDASVGTDTLRSVELVRGSIFADIYNAVGFGSASTNAGSSGAFNEIEGFGGNDTITGNGSTQIAFFNATGAVTVDIAAGTATGDASVGSDTFTGVSQVVGSQFNDTLQGSSATSELFRGGAGNDLIDGRGGFDTAQYAFDTAVTSGISVDMASGIVTGGTAVGTDTLRGVEGIQATDFADTYVATGFSGSSTNAGSNGAFNQVQGMGGNDTITGNGNTSISYNNATSAVTVDLAAGAATGNASVGTDTITGGVNAVVGSGFADTISGSSGNETLQGQAGGDRLDGRGGNDTLTGGTGGDTFVIGANSGADVITDFNQSQGDKIDLTGVTGFYSLLDILEHGTQSGANTVLDLGGGNTLTLNNTMLSNLTESDFVFSVPGPVIGDGTDNTLVGTSVADLIQGLAGKDVLQGRAGNDTLDGGAGIDRATYVDATGGLSINMAAGTVSGAGVGSDTLISIEAVRGSNFADTYVATGYAGNIDNFPQPATRNVFEGMAGNDTITGNGDTQISLVSATGGVTVDLVLGTAVGDASVGTDTLSGIAIVRGSSFADTLLGNTNSGTQQFFGGGGDDLIDGRGGFDAAVYFQQIDNDVTGGITVNMATGIVTGDASVGTDTLRSIESVRGTQFADTYVATGFGLAGALNVGNNGTFNDFDGLGGDDTITGNGNTRLSFASSSAAVTADITAGTATGAATGNDTFTGVNALVGSAAGDTFYGSNNAVNTSEQFDGRGGNDTFDGRGGFDQAIYNQDNTVTTGITVAMAAGTVTGDAAVGTDTLRSIESVRGTNLADTYDATGFATASALNIGSAGTIGAFGGTLNEFEGAGGNDTITGSGDTRISHASATGSVIVDLAAGTVTGDASVGSDVITGGVARVRGSNFNDTISGDSGANVLEGLNGNDRINGRGGADTMTGGANNDVFVFSDVLDSPGGATMDVITDFTVGTDQIDLSAIDANTLVAGEDVFAFVSGQTTVVVQNSVTWYQSGGNTFVQGDVNGDTSADFVIMLTGLKSLTTTDVNL